MGFALWLDREEAWCAGTHEYRPMGTAVVAATDLFAARDFHPRRPAPSRLLPHFHGLFASLEDVNHYLKQEQPKPRGRGQMKSRARLGAVL
ncbi:MAG: hypothetical protein IT168_19180 [Bryobacterales bacterium]|nr:hypothetical protein [Bryobacterales bacterium]